MSQKIKKFFSVFYGFTKKWLILTFPENKRSLWFGAFLFFVIFGLVFSSRPALAQIPGFSCGFGDLACAIGSFILSVMIKFAVLIFFGIPLLLSALFVAIVGLILGWIISPDFISLKFTQNPFVDIGLSITRNFANMGFILFLVVIALATALRIEEYKAKKTLPTLIIIALLINFSPVLCGFIIDASNIVMNFFLTNITGINGFVNFVYNAALSIWNLLVTSGFDVWANIAAAMQIIISIVFNYFAGFIFILFSALFIMRYIMLWILVILSPIAFVSYILPATRRGGSLLSWRKWWEQLIAWSIIGIIAGFFLYLGFTMISMINAAPGTFVTQPDFSWGGTGLGLMNNVLPYLIPLVLLWIAYQQTKRTSAMFAREIIEIPEKVTKAAVSAAIIAGAAVATAGVGAAAGAAGGAAKGLPGAVGRFGGRLKKYGEEHEGTLPGTVAGTVGGGIERFGGWAKTRKEATTGWSERRKESIEGIIKEVKEEHPTIAKTGGWMKKQAKAGLEGALLGFTKKEKVEGREMHPIEKEQGVRYKEVMGKEKIPFSPAERQRKTMIMPNGKERKLAKEYLERGFVEEERKIWIATDQELTKEETDSGHLINTRRTRIPGGLIPSIKGIKPAIKKGFKQAWEEIEKKYVKEIKSLTDELKEEALELARKDLEDIGSLKDETKEKMRSAFPAFRKMEDEGREFGRSELEKFEEKLKKKGKKKSGSEKTDSESENEE